MPYIKYKSEEGTKPFYKLALDVVVRILAAGLMCGIVYISLNTVFFSLGSETTGYTLQKRDSEGVFQTVETVEFNDEITALPENLPEDERAIATTEWTVAGKNAYNITSQIFMILLFSVMLYTVIWSCGDADRNLVHYGHIKRDKLKGLKTGLLAAIPAFLTWIIQCIYGFGVFNGNFASVYAVVNIPFKPYIDLVLGNGFAWYDAFLLLIAPIGFIVLYCFAVYEIGYRQILVGEKLIYKSK